MTDKTDNNNGNSTSTEERILLAAENEFMRNGFVGARTTSIAEAAGVTHAMLHYYYRTKDKLFNKVIDDKISALARTFIIDIDDDRPLADCLRTSVERHFEFVRANPLLPRFMVGEVLSNEPLLDRLREKIAHIAAPTIRNLQHKINKAVAKGECRYVEATSIILDIVSLNVFPILASQMVVRVKNIGSQQEYEKFLDSRKEENVKTILSRIKA